MVLVNIDVALEELDKRLKKVERLIAEPLRDPDGTSANRRLLQIRQWCDRNDPWGSTAAGFIVRLMRVAIDQRIYDEHGAGGDSVIQRDRMERYPSEWDKRGLDQ